jgi:ATPase subunit of ABC transporter with duplicated ATPase domains
MKLTHVQIRHIKHVLDSSEVAIQPDITCLVGKNESGKSAFLEALRRLKPSQGIAKFSSATHYPAWLEKRHRREAKAAGRDLDDTLPITAKFELEEADKQAVADVFGDEVLVSGVFEISRKYDNKYSGIFQVDEQRAIANLLANFNLTKPLSSLKVCKTFADLRAEIVKLTPTGDDASAIS